MSKNPYHTDDARPTMRRSVLAYMDVLGYSELVRAANTAEKQQAALERLHSALSLGRGQLEDRGLDEELRRLIVKERYALKAFTDNIVMGWPIRDDAESELGEAVTKLAEFQFNMILRGYFVRGAITIGDAYVDDVAVFGPALIVAHEGETALARDPRIVLMPEAVVAAQRHLAYYANPDTSWVGVWVLKDADSQWFVSYLEFVLMFEEEAGPLTDELLRHKEAVEANLAAHSAHPAIWSKYAWAATYHNYFCAQHVRYFDASYLIRVEAFRNTPSLVTRA